MEEKKPLKIKFKTAIVLIIIGAIILTIFGANVYASKHGYDNIFFLIKYKITGENEKITDRDKLLIEDDDKKIVENQKDDTKFSDEGVKTENNKNIVLYNGMEILTKAGIQDISDMKNTEDNKNKFNTKYYNYENGKYLNESIGTFGDETYEGYSVVSNVKRIAMTKKYTAIPREYVTINKLPNELADMSDYSSVNIDEIDLDGDGLKEHIVCYTFNASADDYEDGEIQASSGIMLFDNNYKKIADLVTLDQGFWGNIKTENNKMFLSLKDIEYIDINEDGIMEIIIKVPSYSGTKISILEYKNKILNGEKNIKASLLP